MRLAALLPRLWLLILLTLFAKVFLICLGCASEDVAVPASAPESALRRSFPEQAGKVLAQEEVFVATEQGFALGGSAGAEARRGIEVELPREGGGAIRLRGGGFEVRVREIGAEGEGMIAERAVAYWRTGGTSFWAAAPGGVEEWLHLEAGVAREGKGVAAWEVEGASVRQQGEAVELVDEGGWVRLRVTAPVAYAAGGREVRARLKGRGGRIELSVDAGGEAVLVDPVWSAGGSMSTARRAHTATLLGNSKVLVAGGQGNGNVSLSSAELYDPVTDTWTAAGSMSTARRFHTATLLGNGRVLVAGGYNDGWLASAELYDPVTDTWTAAGSMSTAPYWHTATLLGNGKVLVAGGLGIGGVYSSAELYAPVSNTWTTAGSMSTARYRHTATLLENGKVLVAGGQGNGNVSVSSAELYDPVPNTWTAAGSMSTAPYSHTATLLGNGKVLLAGGYNGSALASVELYDPVPNTWTAAGSLNTARFYHSATRLGNGKVLLAGGSTGPALASAELYDPVASTWTAAGSLSSARANHTATLLGNGKVLLAGGIGVSYLASAELYDSAGSPCTLASDCESGFCADGVCCNTACNAGPCDACSIATGAATDGICALFTGPVCNDGDACTQTDTCQAGTCTGENPVVCASQDQCHDAGTCIPATGLCTNPAKPDGSPCPMGVCAAGVCETGLASNGMPCVAAAECVSGSCADGVCCNTACTGFCSACTLAKKGGGADGTCGLIQPDQADADPDDECAIDLAACGNTGICNGAGACQKRPAGTVCLAASCNGNVLIKADICNGDGSCADSGTQDCGNYLCAAGACPSSCAGDAQCVATTYCGGGVCTPKRAEGVSCGADAQCVSDACIAGLCQLDADKDDIPDGDDNCPADANPLQTNSDGPSPAGDLLGDICDPDDDNDGVLDGEDNCPVFYNPAQADLNNDGVGDICDCDNPPKPDGTPCDDGNTCTQSDTCQGNVCAGANLVQCSQPPPINCKNAVCEPANGTCILLYKLDGAPCPGGECIAGGCFTGEVTGSSTAGSGGAGAGGGGQGAGMAAGGSSSSTAGAGGIPVTYSPGGETLRLHGNGCDIGQAPSRGAPWLLVGLLLASRRRSAASRSTARSGPTSRSHHDPA